MWVQIQKVLDSDGLTNDQLTSTYGLAVSVDATTILAGSSNDDDKGTNAGKAVVFVRSDLRWVQQAKLLASDGAAGDNFGLAIGLSANGNTALIGSPNDDTPQANRGSAYVFIRTGTIWTQQAKLLALDGTTNDNFGFSVSLSADGSTAAIGATSKAGGGNAYIFVRSGVTWSQQAKLAASDRAAGDQFGNAISLSSDGNTVLIGATADAAPATGQGSAYVFIKSGVTTWSQQAKLVAVDGLANDQFGFDVSLSGDGTTALIGAEWDDTVSIDRGSAYVFVKSGVTWSQQAKLVVSDGLANDQFGYSVSLSANGNKAVIGMPLDDIGLSTDQGSAYVFARVGTSWNQEQKLVVADGAPVDNLGERVVISPDAQFVVLGAPLDDDRGANSGSFYIFSNLFMTVSDINMCCNPIKTGCDFQVYFNVATSDVFFRQKDVYVYVNDIFKASDRFSDKNRHCYCLTAPSTAGDYTVKIRAVDRLDATFSDLQVQTLYVRNPTCPSYLSGCSGLPFTPTASGAVTITDDLSDALNRIFTQHELLSCCNNCCCSSFVLDSPTDLTSLVEFINRSDLVVGSAAYQLQQLISSSKPTCC